MRQLFLALKNRQLKPVISEARETHEVSRASALLGSSFQTTTRGAGGGAPEGSGLVALRR